VRAGATEFLHPPVETALRNALDRISAHLVKSGGKSREGGKVLGFLGAKGGCGTTTAACHFALALSGLDQGKVLLADLDSSAGMVGFLMKSKSRYSIEDAASNTHRLDPSFWAALTSNGLPGLEVITAPPPVDNRGKATPESYRQVLNFLRTQYALTVVDLGRGLSALTLSVLDEIDETYLVTTMEVPALHQAKEIVQTLRLAGYGEKRLRLLLNRVPKNPEITQDELEGIFGLPVFGALPNDYQALYDAYAEGSLLPAEANLRRHIARMARKMAGVPEEPAKRRFSFLG
jgi:pilus assembly protein CpaE